MATILNGVTLNNTFVNIYGGELPTVLFAAGEQGVWYDPSDMSTLFQDSAGTTPVTAVEQPVGRMLDKSGRGNHATQAADAARPVLSARVNLLTKTQELDDAAWTATDLTATDGAADPNGGSTADTLEATGANGTVTQSITAVAASHIFSVWMRRKTGTGNVDITCHSGGTWVTQTITSDWARYSVTQTLTAGTCTPGIRIVTSGDEVEAWGADLRVASDGVGLPTYQRVNTSTDYDTVGFPMYLLFDESNDTIATGSIDFTSTDKITIFSGLRRFKATAGLIVEFSNNWNNFFGSFLLFTGSSATGLGDGFNSASRGSAGATAGQFGFTSATFAPPVTVVFTATHNIARSLTSVRGNGVAGQNGIANKGFGNFGNHALYIGSRGGTSLHFGGRLYGLIVRGAETNPGVISSIENYVNSKTKAY
jgi:hypothetical protein